MTKFESVLSQALELDEDEREMLARRLGMTLRDEKEPGYDEAWAAELKKRIDEEDRGEADLVDWDEFRRELVADD